MATVTKKKIIQVISQTKGIHPNEVRIVVQEFLDEVKKALVRGDKLEFRDFGVFEIVLRKKKIGRNPKDANVAIVIPERKAVKFTAGKEMARLVDPEYYQKLERDAPGQSK